MGELNIQIVASLPIQALLKYKFTHVHHAYYIRLVEHSTPHEIHGASNTNPFHIVCTMVPYKLTLADCSVFRGLSLSKGRYPGHICVQYHRLYYALPVLDIIRGWQLKFE